MSRPHAKFFNPSSHGADARTDGLKANHHLADDRRPSRNSNATRPLGTGGAILLAPVYRNSGIGAVRGEPRNASIYITSAALTRRRT